MSDSFSFQSFEASARAQGFDEVLVREWAPAQVLDTHRHPFDVKALVVRGELSLTVGNHSRTLHAGATPSNWPATCHMPSATAPRAPHSGSPGATLRPD